MSVKEASSPSSGEVVEREDTAKRQRVNRFVSFMEISVEPGIKSLKHLDSKKFKNEIKRWAKAVVAYARQVSKRFGSSRRSESSESSCRSESSHGYGSSGR
ncbi:uncharacterized protein LOC132282863 [Cornus florida]|uniref:uncharacterized protein LOC132282863 n=1 Tax=Cornus florida TaxID=4283 RepID=UPI00289B98CE|nr:uncharacterized protein LOC132282863 [Cornus florida]